MKKVTGSALACFFLGWMMVAVVANGQHGPALVNYTVAQYRAHNQNWSVSQGDDRRIFIGNTDGLLVFNGNTWQLNRLPSGKIVRSAHVSNQRIYTGAYAEIGFWQANACDEFTYTNLTHLVPSSWIEKEEIWNIIESGPYIYFQSFSLLLKYDGKTMEKVRLPGSIMFLHKVEGRLLIQSLGFGIYEIFSDDRSTLLAGSTFFSDKTLTGITALGSDGALLVATSRHGMFVLENGICRPWNQEFTSYFVDVQINRTMKTRKGMLALGTIRDRVLLFSEQGSLLHHIHTTNGLQNNTVIAMHEDSDGQLWLGLDKGMCVIRIDDPLQFYNDITGSIGTVYCVARHQGSLYVGTNQGVYKSVPEGGFTLVKGSQGQVWQLLVTDGQLLCGHNEGTFLIKNGEANNISSVTGGWCSVPIAEMEDIILQGTYTGLVVLKKKAGQWYFSHKIEGFMQPVKKLLYRHPGNVWVTGPNDGVSLLLLDSNFLKIKEIRDFGSLQAGGNSGSTNADLSEFAGQIAVFDGLSHFLYDSVKQDFYKDKWLNQWDRSYHIRHAEGLGDGQWFQIFSDSIVWWKKKTRQTVIPLKGNRDYYGITSAGNGEVAFCLNEGYAVYSSARERQSKEEAMPLILARVEAVQSESCFPLAKDKKLTLPYSANSFRLFFYDALYRHGKVYEYRILPVFEKWQETNGQGYFDVANLAPGQYAIELRRTGSGCGFVVLDLRIDPPWYLSQFAFAGYFLLIAFLVFQGIRIFDQRLSRAKKRLEEENERILREHKIRMENDRLTQDNLTKSRELANTTMQLVQKNEILQEIKEEITAIRKTGDHVLTARDFQLIMRQINENLTLQEDKNLFDQSFYEVHEPFFKALKGDFPSLSPADLQLAAFIKMNLSSKEIAPLFNISLRGLENKRYRLRKKLNLPNEASLTDFFIMRY